MKNLREKDVKVLRHLKANPNGAQLQAIQKEIADNNPQSTFARLKKLEQKQYLQHTTQSLYLITVPGLDYLKKLDGESASSSSSMPPPEPSAPQTPVKAKQVVAPMQS